MSKRHNKHLPSTHIKIKLNDLKQLFNEIDPAPFREKDLDGDASNYILNSVREHHIKTPLSLTLFLPKEKINAADTDTIVEAIHNFFEYEENISRQNLKSLFREGQMALVVGLFFLFLCLSASHYILSHTAPANVTRHILGEGLNIIGWVAMWKPIEIFLYEWRPIKLTQRYQHKLSLLPIEIKGY